LAAEIRDVRVHGARGHAELLVDAPDLLEQLLAAHGATAVLDQVLEELELLERERHLLAGLVHLARLEAHLDVAERVRRRPRGAEPHAARGLVPDPTRADRIGADRTHGDALPEPRPPSQTGRRIVNVLPSPGVLATSTRP